MARDWLHFRAPATKSFPSWERSREKQLNGYARRYTRRNPEQTILYRIVYHSRQELEYRWEDWFQQKYGALRKVVLEAFDAYLNCGMHLHGKEAEAARWSRLRLDRLVAEDIRDLLAVSDLSAFRVLAELLPERVGSLLSINALREDVGKAYATVRSWYHVLEALYFRLRSGRIISELPEPSEPSRKCICLIFCGFLEQQWQLGLRILQLCIC